MKVILTFNEFVFDLYKWCVFIAATSKTSTQRLKLILLAV